MGFYRLFTHLTFIALLVPTGSAWAGAGPDEGRVLCGNLEPLMHICRGGAHAGQQCPPVATCIARDEPNPCPEECFVKYVPERKLFTPLITDVPAEETLTLTIPATVTFKRIDQTTNQTTNEVKVAIFLEVKKDEDGIPHLFEIPAQSYKTESVSFARSTRAQLEAGLLFRQVPEQLATSLIELFKFELCQGLYGDSGCPRLPKNLIPVIARIKEPIYRHFAGSLDLGAATPDVTVLGVPVDIGFAFLRQTAASIPGDLNCDGNVDKFDLKTLVLDLNKSVSESTCRTTPCSTTCDLDGDGMITALDSRKLACLSPELKCATE